MKMYVLLFITAITISISTTFFALKINRDQVATSEERKEISTLIKNFETKNQPEFQIDLSSLYPNQNFIELIQLNNTMATDNFNNVSKTYSKNCQFIEEKMSLSLADKDEVFERFLCKKIKELPTDFISSSPYMRHTGSSFALELYLSGIEPFINHEWIRNNLNFFHITELSSLPQESLDGNFKVLASLNSEELNEVMTQSFPVVTNNYLITNVRENNLFNLRFYSISKFNNSLKKMSYYYKVAGKTDTCFIKRGMLCFEKNSHLLISKFHLPMNIILVLSFALLIFVSVSLYLKISSQKKEEEQKRLALRVLTHELRTPITNMLLLMDNLHRNLDLVPKEIEEDFLKFETEIYRLKRLAEKSSNYLNTHDKDKSFHLELIKILSFSDYLEHVLHDLNEENIIVDLINDGQVMADPYWLSVCLKNIIENANKYGKAPLSIKTFIEGGFLNIAISDSGEFKYQNLEDAIKNARSSDKSLGIGLSIVKKIVESMNGKLEFKKNPTTFTIKLKAFNE